MHLCVCQPRTMHDATHARGEAGVNASSSLRIASTRYITHGRTSVIDARYVCGPLRAIVNIAIINVSTLDEDAVS